MANKGFNGTTLSFAAAGQTPLNSLSYDESGAEVQTTGAGDSEHTFEAGIPNKTVTAELVGGSSVAVGDEGAISISFNDGTSESITNAVCTGKSTSGSVDSPIATTLTFKPSLADT